MPDPEPTASTPQPVDETMAPVVTDEVAPAAGPASVTGPASPAADVEPADPEPADPEPEPAAPEPADPEPAAPEPAEPEPAEPEPAGARADEGSSTRSPAVDPPTRDAELTDPTEADLLRTAVPATVRRAPRYGAFITAGLIVGLVVGLTLAVVLDRGSVTDAGGVLPFLGGSNGPRLLSALAGAALGVLVGASLALWADRRSLRR